MAKKKKDKEYKPKAWKGTVRAMITKHPEKFDPKASGEGPKLNPYAVATAMAKKGHEPHYKSQKTTLKGKPVKKEKYKDEDKPKKKKKKKGFFSEWLENNHPEFFETKMGPGAPPKKSRQTRQITPQQPGPPKPKEPKEEKPEK